MKDGISYGTFIQETTMCNEDFQRTINDKSKMFKTC